MWAGPTLIFFFHVEHGPVACGLWCVLVGGTHPFFPFPLEGWGNTPNPLSFWDSYFQRSPVMSSGSLNFSKSEDLIKG